MTHHLEVVVSRPDGKQRKYRFAVRGDATYVWVECGEAAPPAGVIFPVLVYCGLVKVVREDDLLTVDVPGRWYDRFLGVWGRTGRTGAYWGHAWEVDPEGHRKGHWVAQWHVSMTGKVNEDIEGDPYVLTVAWALMAWHDFVSDGANITIRSEIPTITVQHPLWVPDPGVDLPVRPVVEDQNLDSTEPLEPVFPPPPTV